MRPNEAAKVGVRKKLRTLPSRENASVKPKASASSLSRNQ